MPKETVCKRVPNGVRHHAAFVVDTTALAADIVSYGDNNGSWTGHTKPRRKYHIEIDDDTDMSIIQEFESLPEDTHMVQNNVNILCRNYFHHANTPEFRKLIATVRDCKGTILPLAVIQYYFEGGIEVPVKLTKHGNAKDNASPYMRTSRPVLQKLKKKCAKQTCRKAVEECFQEGGGTCGIRAVADVPRNRKQAYNLNQKTAKENHSGKQSHRHEFYDEKHPVFIGPSVLHMSKEFEDYHYLARLLKTHCKNFENVTAFGTDGEINLANAFLCELPDAIHLRCKIHLSENIEGKMAQLSFDKDAQQSILCRTFGRRQGDSRTKALVDANSAEEFEEMLDTLETEWRVLESTQRSAETLVFSWFKRHIAMVMKDNMISSVREKAGLGSAPEFILKTRQNVATVW